MDDTRSGWQELQRPIIVIKIFEGMVLGSYPTRVRRNTTIDKCAKTTHLFPLGDVIRDTLVFLVFL